MTLTGIGIVIAVVGLILLLVTTLTVLGWALIIAGIVVALVGAFAFGGYGRRRTTAV